MRTRFLYRGANPDLHKAGNVLRSKGQGTFEYSARYGETTYGGGWTYGTSDANAVLRHQHQQAGFPTSGISTTPLYERAVFYATNGPGGTRYETGYVYKIDRDALESCGVREYVVTEYAVTPSVPEDDEIILVPARGTLPDDVPVEIIKVEAPSRSDMERLVKSACCFRTLPLFVIHRCPGRRAGPLISGPAQTAGCHQSLSFKSTSVPRNAASVVAEKLSRRLITLIFAGRNRIIVIRREPVNSD